MKKTLLTLLLVLLLAGLGYSQKTGSGTFIAGGNIGLSFNTEKFDDGTAVSTEGKHNLIEMTPSVGYFVIDGLAVGVGVNLLSETFKNDGTADKTTESAIALAPFARYYLDMGVFGHAGVSLGSGSFKDTQDNAGVITTTTSKRGLFGFEIGGGYAYFLNDNVAIEPMLVYSSSNVIYKDVSPNQRSIEGGLQFRIGINVFL